MVEFFYYAALFAASCITAYLIATTLRQGKSQFPIEPDAIVQFTAPGGKVKCRFVRESRDGLVFAAALQPGAYSPLRPKDSVFAQCPLDGRLAAFRVTVLSRNPSTQELLMTRPGTIKYTDRRREVRLNLPVGSKALLDGSNGALVDISDWGARVNSPLTRTYGESVRFELPDRGISRDAWVMNLGDSVGGSRELSLMFSEPLKLPS